MLRKQRVFVWESDYEFRLHLHPVSTAKLQWVTRNRLQSLESFHAPFRFLKQDSSTYKEPYWFSRPHAQSPRQAGSSFVRFDRFVPYS